jgi:protein-S-isoprenylcysteine O-methyltransferase Ste14
MPKQDNAATLKYPRIRLKHLLVYSSIFIAVPILAFIIGKVLDNMFLLPSFPPLPINIILGSAIFFSGLGIGIKATRTLFKKGHGLPWGELNERSQTKKLVTNGIYAYTRNPMVIGYSLLPCGMGIMFRSLSMTVLITAMALLSSAWVARTREEKSLEKRFGEAYVEYKKNTPFLIPQLKPLLMGFTRVLLTTIKEVNGDKLAQVKIIQLVLYSISLLSLLILAFLTLTAQPVGVQVAKETIGAAFGAICMLGIAAGISPSRCNRLFTHIQKKETGHKEQESTTLDKPYISFIGHHPNCGSFSSHVIQIGGRVYCAGCVGLVVGASIALIGNGCYMFLQSLPAQSVSVIFWSGLAGVTLGLLQYELFINKASLHFLLNVIFVVGAFLLLVGVNEMNGSLSISVYFLLVILFLINTRSTLSRLEHKKICTICKLDDCSMK